MRWVDCPKCRTSQALEDAALRSTHICRNCGHAFNVPGDEQGSMHSADLAELEGENDPDSEPPTLLVVEEDNAAQSDDPVPGEGTYRIEGGCPTRTSAAAA